MTFTNVIKLFCYTGYLSLIVMVPGPPNKYTFMVEFLGFTLTVIASLLILDFLTTRPNAQKNLLNRILILLVVTFLLGTTRNFFMTFVTSFFHTDLQLFVDSYPFLAITFLSMRVTGVMECFSVMALSVGRLLLYTNPVVFHNLNPTHGLLISTVIMIIVCCFDLTFTWISCYTTHDLPDHTIIINLYNEQGLKRPTTEVNITSLEDGKKEHNGKQNVCHPIPIADVLLLGAFVFEVVRFIFVLIKNKKTVPLANAQLTATASSTDVVMAPSLNQNVTISRNIASSISCETSVPFDTNAAPASAATSLPFAVQGLAAVEESGDSSTRIVGRDEITSGTGDNITTALPAITAVKTCAFGDLKPTRSESLPQISRSEDNQKRRHSLQFTPIVKTYKEKPSERVGTVLVKNLPNMTVQHGQRENNLNNIIKIINLLYLRSSSIVTVGALIVLVITAHNYLNIHTSSYLMIVIQRLFQYCLTIALVAFDKDILQYLIDKFQ